MKSLFFAAIISALLFVAGPRWTFAIGPDRASTTDSVVIETGNKWPTREVKMSTMSAVIISSAAENSGLGISSWRKRTITNMSTTSVLGLYPEDTTNTTYNYSNGVTLSSMTTQESIVTVGNTITINHQAAIKGIWKAPEGGTTTFNSLMGGRGALVTEEYWK